MVNYRPSKIRRDWPRAPLRTIPNMRYRSELQLGQRVQTLLHAEKKFKIPNKYSGMGSH